MPRGPKGGGMSVVVDMSGLEKHIATGITMNGLLRKQKGYKDNIVEFAFEQANQEFNRMAVAYGKSGHIKHMFEWGTLGINRNESSVRPSPLDERARLWKTSLMGRGNSRNVIFNYKPSIGLVPLPTVRNSGISNEIKGMLRRHVFTWKALVFESGSKVTIEPKEAKFLLIPRTKENEAFFRPNDKKRGYILSRGPISAVPGRKAAGNFTSIWTAFWETDARGIMDESIESQVKSDFDEHFMGVSKKVFRTPSVKAFYARVEKLEKEIEANVYAKSKARRGAITI